MYEDIYKDFISASEEVNKALQIRRDADLKFEAAKREKDKIGAEAARIFVLHQFGLKVGDVIDITRKTYRYVTFRIKITNILGGFYENWASNVIENKIVYRIIGVRVLKAGGEGVRTEYLYPATDKWTKIPETEVSHE